MGQLAAAAAGDAGGLEEAVRFQEAQGRSEDLPMSQAARHIRIVLVSLVAGRWEQARVAYLAAEPVLAEIGHAQLLAQLQLAVGHLGAARLPEANEAAAEAEAYFHARGADAYVVTYRAHAAKGSMPAEPQPARAKAAEGARV
jgi:hypothetical protein